MKRDISIYLTDILESIAQIEKYTLDVEEEQFEEDDQLQDAVIRRVEIIGEVAKGIPQSVRKKYARVPWKEFAGMRDILKNRLCSKTKQLLSPARRGALDARLLYCLQSAARALW